MEALTRSILKCLVCCIKFIVLSPNTHRFFFQNTSPLNILKSTLQELVHSLSKRMFTILTDNKRFTSYYWTR